VRILSSKLADFAGIMPGGKAQIIGIFDRIAPLEVPYVQPILFLWTTITGDDDDEGVSFDLGVSVTAPDGSQLLAGEPSHHTWQRVVPDGPLELDAMLGFVGLQFSEYGAYKFTVQIIGRDDVERFVRTLYVDPPPKTAAVVS
jgi:hypothetical protein